MAPASAPTKPSPALEAATGYRIIDVVEVRTSFGAPAPGFILVPDGFLPPDPGALPGEVVVIEPPGGGAVLGKIAGARDHGPTTSLLVEHWPEGFPRPQIGWTIRVPAIEPTAFVEVARRDDRNRDLSLPDPPSALISSNARGRQTCRSIDGPDAGGTSMADDLSKKMPQDASQINVHEPWELAYWTKKLGVTEQELKDAVKAVGTHVSKVTERLAG